MPEFELEEPFPLGRFHNAVGLDNLGSQFLIGSTLPEIFTSDQDEDHPDHVLYTIQGEGIKLYNTTDQKCTQSWTTPPGVVFAQPAIHQTTSENELQYTYALIASGPEIPKDEENKTVWVWRDKKTRSGEEPLSANRIPQKFSKRIYNLHTTSTLATNLILIQECGEIQLVTKDLDTALAKSKEHCHGRIIWSFVFVIPSTNAGACFVPASVAPTSSVVVVTVSHEDTVDTYTLRMHVISQGSRQIPEIARVDLKLKERPLSFTFSPNDGKVTTLGIDGTWTVWDLQIKSSSKTPATVSKCFSRHITGFRFHDSHIGPLASSTALPDGYVAMIAPRMDGNTAEQVVTIWDVQYGTVQASFPLKVVDKQHIQSCRCQVVALNNASLALCLTHVDARLGKASKKKAKSDITSVALLMSYVCEPMSLMAAVGTMQESASFMGITQENEDDEANIGLTRSSVTAVMSDEGIHENTYDAWTRKLQTIQKDEDKLIHALSSRSLSADAFTRMFMEHIGVAPVDQPANMASLSIEDQTAAYQSMMEAYQVPAKCIVSSRLVKTVISRCFTEVNGRPNMAKWCLEPVLLLLKMQALPNSIIPGGLVPALLARKQLSLLPIVLETVSDLPEADVATLMVELVNLKQRDSTEWNARFPTYLLMAIDTRWSDVLMQQALDRFTSAELVIIMNELLGLLENSNMSLATYKLKKVVDFTNLILNVHFPTVILEPHLHITVAKLKHAAAELNKWFDELYQLRGMLRFFDRKPNSKQVQQVVPLYSIDTFSWNDDHGRPVQRA